MWSPHARGVVRASAPGWNDLAMDPRLTVGRGGLLRSCSAAMKSAMERYNPFSGHPATYGAWHIRTPKGENSYTYHAESNRYVIRAPSSVVCPSFMAVTSEVLRGYGGGEDIPVFIATNK